MPPVARIRAVDLCFISAWVPSIVATDMHPIEPAGKPADWAASLITLAVSFMQLVAEGWGLSTIASRAFIAISILKIAVEVGFVEGMIAATTPRGDATSITLSVSLITPTVRIGRMKL